MIFLILIVFLFVYVSWNPSINDLSILIKNILPDTQINYLPGKKNEDSFEMDGAKMKNELGLIPKYSLSKGIKELIFDLKYKH